MSVANFRPYEDGEDIPFHDENVVIICESSATCYGTDPINLIEEEKDQVEDCPEFVDATPEPSGLEIARESMTDVQSQMELHIHSLWLVQYSCLLEKDCSSAISNNGNLVPDEGRIVIWVDCDGDRDEVANELKGIIPDAEITKTERRFRRMVWGYIEHTANPDDGESSLRDWSQEVNGTIKRLDPNE